MTRRAMLPDGAAGARATRESAPAIGAGTVQTVLVALHRELADGVLIVIATTRKMGASYHDSWSISPSLALVSITVVEPSTPGPASYVSRAAVEAGSLEADTTYTFSYAIVMRAGEQTWAGSGIATVTVSSDGSMPPVDSSAPSAT